MVRLLSERVLPNFYWYGTRVSLRLHVGNSHFYLLFKMIAQQLVVSACTTSWRGCLGQYAPPDPRARL